MTRNEQPSRVKSAIRTNSRSRSSKILNSHEFKTYNFIILLNQVKSNKYREHLKRNCKATENNSEAVYVKARAFHLNDILKWMGSNYEMSNENVAKLQPLVKPNNTYRVDVDLTMHSFDKESQKEKFSCLVDIQRKLFKQVHLSQTPLYTPINKYAEMINPVYVYNENDTIKSITYNSIDIVFYKSEIGFDNEMVYDQVSLSAPRLSTSDKESLEAENVRLKLQKAGFKGLVPNTGYTVCVDDKDNDIIFFTDKGNAHKVLVRKGFHDLSLNHNEVLNFDDTTISDAYHALNM
jgi:hypothetical protein